MLGRGLLIRLDEGSRSYSLKYPDHYESIVRAVGAQHRPRRRRAAPLGGGGISLGLTIRRKETPLCTRRHLAIPACSLPFGPWTESRRRPPDWRVAAAVASFTRRHIGASLAAAPRALARRSAGEIASAARGTVAVDERRLPRFVSLARAGREELCLKPTRPLVQPNQAPGTSLGRTC